MSKKKNASRKPAVTAQPAITAETIVAVMQMMTATHVDDGHEPENVAENGGFCLLASYEAHLALERGVKPEAFIELFESFVAEVSTDLDQKASLQLAEFYGIIATAKLGRADELQGRIRDRDPDDALAVRCLHELASAIVAIYSPNDDKTKWPYENDWPFKCAAREFAEEWRRAGLDAQRIVDGIRALQAPAAKLTEAPPKAA